MNVSRTVKVGLVVLGLAAVLGFSTPAQARTRVYVSAGCYPGYCAPTYVSYYPTYYGAYYAPSRVVVVPSCYRPVVVVHPRHHYYVRPGVFVGVRF